jgi:cation transport regulator
MKYETKEDLPKTIREVLPEEAQEVYLKAYGASWDSYSSPVHSTLDRDAIAHRDAWDALMRQFEQDSLTGEWHRRGVKVLKAAETDGLLRRIRHVFAHSS